MTIGLFEAIITIRQALAKRLIELLDKYGLKKNKNMYVKGEGSNFNATTIALKYIINCESLRLKESFQGTCFGCFFICISIWHYKGKVFKNLKYVSIKYAQANLQKCITCLSSLGKKYMNGIRFVLKLEFNPKIQTF